MTVNRKHAPRRRFAPAAALAALLLAGCSSGHVGEDWQCPLAAGGSCASVAAADPAVPDTSKSGRPVLAGPLWLAPRGDTTAGVHAASADTRPCAKECGFDPFGWLARLFGADAGNIDAESKETVPATRSAIDTPRAAAIRPVSDEPGVTAPPDAPANANAPPEEPAPAAPPAAPEEATNDRSDTATLRTGEAVARIWIAPFVDANGVYREAAWVRAVLAPAGWRLR